MREAWYKGLSKIGTEAKDKAETVEAVEGGFDDFAQVDQYGVKQGEADAVIIAQAWHWCPDHEKALVSQERSYVLM